jgi:hypothetical protein
MPCGRPATRHECPPPARKYALELSIAFRITSRKNCSWQVTRVCGPAQARSFLNQSRPNPELCKCGGASVRRVRGIGLLASRNSGQTKFRCADKWCCRQNGQVPRDSLQVVRWGTLRARRKAVHENDQFLCSHGMQIGTSPDSYAAVAIEGGTEPMRTPVVA